MCWMSESSQNQEKSSSDKLGDVLEKLTTDQVRFVVARQEFSTDKEAAHQIGVKPNTVYTWKHKGAPIDEAVRLMAYDGIVVARDMLRRSLAKAAAVKVAGLDDRDDRLRQAVATEILDRELGKPTQRQEIEHSGKSEITINLDWGDGPTDEAV